MSAWARANFPEDHEFQIAVDTMNAEFDPRKSFELVLSDLDKRIELLQKRRPTTQKDIELKVTLIYLRSTIKAMIPLYFNSLRSQPADYYRAFAEDVLKCGDAVITFNYDLAIDREMRRAAKWTIGNGYGFDINTESHGDSPCKLFKLHGSTNWRGELFQGSEGFGQTNWSDLSLGRRPVIDQSEFEFLEYRNGSDPRNHNGRVRIESIIMPTAIKKFYNETSYGREWEDFWDGLWVQAGAALSRAREVYLIGYSLPEYDSRAGELLAGSIDGESKIKVCCHNSTDGVIARLGQLKSVGSLNIQPACSITFEGWLSTASSW